MGSRNITLSLPEEVLIAARHLAVERGSSLSRLLAEYVEKMLSDDEEYRKAMRRAKRRLAAGFELGSRGAVRARREELHER
jgi:hypothetical protein